MRLISLKIDGPDLTPITIQGAKGQPMGDIHTLVNILRTGVSLLILLAIILSLFSLIYLGFLWLTSQGDKQKLQQARQRFSYILVGLVLIFISFFILAVLGKFFQVNLLNIPTT